MHQLRWAKNNVVRIKIPKEVFLEKRSLVLKTVLGAEADL